MGLVDAAVLTVHAGKSSQGSGPLFVEQRDGLFLPVSLRRRICSREGFERGFGLPQAAIDVGQCVGVSSNGALNSIEGFMALSPARLHERLPFVSISDFRR